MSVIDKPHCGLDHVLEVKHFRIASLDLMAKPGRKILKSVEPQV
jgi:hypothetical protein